jgi:pimeloyl-ACP methyl ester carboxylesterase
MMRFNLFLFSLVGLTVSCIQKDTTDVQTNDTIMDSIRTVQLDREGLIQGQAGLLYVDSKGSGDMAVVFLHSFGGSNRHWESQFAHLRERHHVVAFDFRGHGKSELPDDKNYSAEALASDLSAIVDSLELERFILVGHSMGGVAAITYAGQHPERVAGLVMVGTPGKTPEEQADKIIESLESPAYQKVMDDYMRRLLVNAKPEVDSLVTREFNNISREASIAIIKAMFAFDPLPSFQHYDGQKLIITTSGEATQPNTLHKLVPEVDYKTIDGTSHWVHLDKPDEFNKLLDEFLKRIK